MLDMLRKRAPHVTLASAPLTDRSNRLAQVATLPPGERILQGPVASLAKYESGSGQGPGKFLTPEDTVKSGDILRITYQLRVPFLQDFLVRALEARWRADKRIQVLHYVYYEETSYIILTCRIISPFSPPLVVAAALAAVAIGFGIWLVAVSVEKVSAVKTPFGDFNIAGAIVAGLVGIFVLKAFK